MQTLYWYDFETFGSDPRRDRASQFAGIRTDLDLNVIGEPLVMYCRPAPDFLPSPMATLITGIAPQHALAEGVAEAEFISRIYEEFSQPQTCVAGYNSIRFDDEVTRQLLYRNFYDPYEREYKNGNSRWDIIDMVRLCAATRPEGIRWPQKEDGRPSFRLEDLTRENGIGHESAHDALSDVLATIEVARLIKTAQPKLYDYVYDMRDKRKVRGLLDLNNPQPVLHVSVMYPSTRGCLALVLPLAPHPGNNNGVIVYDLRVDPASWMDLDPASIRERVYTPSAELEEKGLERIPLKTIHINKCPIVSTAQVLSAEQAERFEIDLDAVARHGETLLGNQSLQRKLVEVFREENHPVEQDPDFMIYSGGFFGERDKSLMQTLRATSPEDLARLDLPFQDARLREMFFRYRARNYPETLNDDEAARWQEFCRSRRENADLRSRYQRELDEAEEYIADRPADEPRLRGLLAAVAEYIDALT